MSGQGFALALEQRRILAVTRVSEGYRQKAVAAFLGVHPGTACSWVRAARKAGSPAGLRAKPIPGRPRKLSRRQERTVLGWVAKAPTHFGFANDLWTTRRLATLIAQRWGVEFNANYLAAWLRAREHSDLPTFSWFSRTLCGLIGAAALPDGFVPPGPVRIGGPFASVPHKMRENHFIGERSYP